MDVTWLEVVLVDEFGSLTADGTHLLEQKLNNEQLSIVSFIGPPSTRASRSKLASKLLGHGDKDIVFSGGDALMVLASIAYAEEDFHVLVLDFNTSETGESFGRFIGIFCALSSLVISCYDEIESTQCLTPFLPPFQSFFQNLVKEFATIEVFEMLPNMMNMDLSPNLQLTAKLAEVDNDERMATVGTLESHFKFKNVGVIDPQSIDEMNYNKIFGTHATVKKLFGLDMTGEMLVFFLRKLSIQLVQQDSLDFGTIWDEFVEGKCQVVAEDALNTYVECVHSSVVESPPMELKAFTQLHEEIWRLSMDLYHSTSKYKSSKRRTVRNKLKADIRAHYETELNILTQKSHAFCEELRRTLWTELYEQATHPRDSETFAALLAAIQDFDRQYNERARGPMKASVLREFYQYETIQAFKQLKHVVKQQFSDTYLTKLRQQLEKEFAEKKKALVDHFKQEEDQMRNRMVRDMETKQKMFEANVARVRLDGSTTKRLQDELSKLKRLNAELQEKTVVLEHSQQEAANQKAVLAAKLNELELTVRREMANRTEVVDTLALTMKNAEEKEKTLNDTIAKLQHELGEKTFRVEGELQDLAQQLRKTNEEKEELQKKLNEILLKVTALPDALQHHIFSMDSDSPVEFADALTSYMSH